MRRSLALLAAFALASAALAADYHVDPLNGSDATGTGAPGAPFATATKALSKAGAGDTVHLAPGVYSTAGGETLPLVVGQQVTLRGAGVHQCRVTGAGDGTLLVTKDQALVSDLHLDRGDVGVFSEMLHYDVRYLRRCRITSCDVGLHFRDWLHCDSLYVLANCSLSGNQVAVRHEVTGWDFNSVTLQLYGTTVTGNGKALEVQGLGEAYLGVHDSIVRGNTDDTLAAYAITMGVESSLLSDPAWVGVSGNLDAAPGLPAIASGDPHLSATGAARDHSSTSPPWPPVGMFTGSTGWLWEAAWDDVRDLDGDARRVGPARDAGCDEFAAPTLHTNAAARLGKVLDLHLQGEPGDLLVTFAGSGLYPGLVAGFLWVQPPWAQLAATVLPVGGFVSLPVQVPAAPSFAGVDLYLQAVRGGAMLVGSGPEWVRLLP